MEKRGTFSRSKIRIILYTTTIILVLGIFSIVQSVKLAKYEQMMAQVEERLAQM